MNWIALGQRYDDRLFGIDPHSALAWNTNDTTCLLSQGSLVIHFDFSSDLHRPAQLIQFQDHDGWQRRFTVFLNADNSMSVLTQQGPNASYARLNAATKVPTGMAKLTYAWNAPARIGILSLEDIETGGLQQQIFQDPIPLPQTDLAHVCKGGDHVKIDERVTTIGLTRAIEPVGPAPTIVAGASVETADGARPIERLSLGDQVVTASHGLQPIRWILRHDLPSFGQLAPIRLRAPFFGLHHDLVVAPQTRIMICGADPEYQFAQDTVFVEAKQLVGHPAAVRDVGEEVRTYYQILLDNHECILVSGAWVESLFLGQLGARPDVIPTTFIAGMSGALVPIHDALARPTLMPFESRALLDAMTA